MKKIAAFILITSLCLTFMDGAAQWLPPGTVTTDFKGRTGGVGVGATTTSNSLDFYVTKSFTNTATTNARVVFGGTAIRGTYPSSEAVHEILSSSNSRLQIYSGISGANSNFATLFSSSTSWGLTGDKQGANSYQPFTISNSGVEQMRILTNGNVGIGATNPMQKLQVDGGNIFTKGATTFTTQGDAAYNYLGDFNNYIKAEHSAGLRLGSFNAFDALTVANGGYVGIGIGNGGGSTFTYPSFMPTSMLHVSRWNPGDAFALFNLPKSGFGNTYGFLVGLEGSHSNDAVLAAQSGNMKFFTNITGNSGPYPPDEANGNLRMTIEGTTGDVGIGTSNPIQRLDINGRVQVQRGVIQKGGNAITSTSDLGLYSLDQSSWLRFVTNAQPMKFYADAGTDPIGVNPLVTINPTGFVNIDKGGIQKGGPTITSTTDLGLYSLDPNAWMRFVTNSQPMKFYTDANVDPKGSNEIMEISPYGQVYIGKPSWPTNNNTNELKLLVKGGILCQKVKVALDGTANWSWPDFVFSTDYKLKSLEEVEQFIKENNHLPDVPSACEITENGIDLAEMNAKLLQKVEELTLHVIAQGKEIEELKKVMGTNK